MPATMRMLAGERRELSPMTEKRRILIADPSRVARTALVKHLRDDFEIREESDGESAWQTLVLDASIVAVVSAINLERASGYELLSRLRGEPGEGPLPFR